MTRYLVRLPNQRGYVPKDIKKVSRIIRNLLGSEENASHFRVGPKALEFNLFADTEKQLDYFKEILQREFSRILLMKELDVSSEPLEKNDSLIQGIELFNEERFWESHEILEHAWKESQGIEKENIQGMILMAAAFVHQQKGENDICLSILARAKTKLSAINSDLKVNIEDVRVNLDRILESKQIVPFQMH